MTTVNLEDVAQLLTFCNLFVRRSNDYWFKTSELLLLFLRCHDRKYLVQHVNLANQRTSPSPGLLWVTEVWMWSPQMLECSTPFHRTFWCLAHVTVQGGAVSPNLKIPTRSCGKRWLWRVIWLNVTSNSVFKSHILS